MNIGMKPKTPERKVKSDKEKVPKMLFSTEARTFFTIKREKKRKKKKKSFEKAKPKKEFKER